MACLSPSPSGRRLSELLEEKQEPFILDLHLLEKGCSSSRLLLDGSYSDTTTTAVLCWPAAAAVIPGNDAAAAVLRRLTSKKQTKTTSANKKPTGGLLKLLLSKILRGSRASTAGAQRKKPAARALQFSDSFKLAAVAPCDSDDRRRHMELDAVKTADDDAKAAQDSDDDEEKQQLSPVSVLDNHPFETMSPSSPTSSSSNGGGGAIAMDVFRDLLDAAYSPALLAQLLAKSDDLLLLLRDSSSDAASSSDDDCYYGGESYYRSSPRNCSAASAAYWEAHREELTRLSELVASEIPSSRLDAGDVQPERRSVGGEVEDAVFQALVQELVVDLWSRSCC